MAGVAAFIPVAMQIFQAIKQGSQANELDREYDRTNMTIPRGILDSLDINKNLALQTGLPRQDIIEDKLNENSANTIQGIKTAATSPWEAISGTQRVNEVASEKLKDVNIAGAEYSANAKSQLADVFEGLAKIEERRFMYNDFTPYVNAMDTVRGLREAGNQNLYSGTSNLAGILAENPNMFNDIFGFKKNKEGKAGAASLESFLSSIESSSSYVAPNTSPNWAENPLIN